MTLVFISTRALSPAKGQPTTPKARAVLKANAAKGPPAAAAARAAEREAKATRKDELAAEYHRDAEARGLVPVPTFVRQNDEQLAELVWLREVEADAPLRRYGSSGAGGFKRWQEGIKLTEVITRQQAAREAAIQAALREAATPNRGQPVQPRRDPEHVGRVLLLLLKQGGVPGFSGSALIRGLADDLAQAIENHLKDRQAALEEIGQLVRGEAQ